MGISCHPDEIRRNIIERDRIDSSREISPLIRPPGAVVIDTSNITIEEQVEAAEKKALEVKNLTQQQRESYLSKGSVRSMNLYYRISKSLVRFFFKILFGLKIKGTGHLQYERNFIFASNHISYGDPPIVGCALDREVSFLAKKELFRNPLFGWLIRKYHAIPIDRESLDRKALTTVISLLKRGQPILMFPQGTRSRDRKLKQVKTGLGFIVLHSRTDIIPVYITGSDSLLNCFLRRNELKVIIGPPVRFHQDYHPENRKKDYQVISDMVLEELRMLKDEAED
jgi:1-acyl-sn-glycerol-3-phosphate acyltransferase